jgi:hypothetical protein
LINVISPKFVDEIIITDNFIINQHNLIKEVKVENGGCDRLIKKFRLKFNWINHKFNKDYSIFTFKPKIILSSGTKTTLVEQLQCDIDLSKCSLNNLHIMYYDYYNLKGKKPKNTLVSIDFASNTHLSTDKVFMLKDKADIIFCSEHDEWAQKKFLKKISKNLIIIFHTPKFIEIYKNQEITRVNNKYFIESKGSIVGLGDMLAFLFLKDAKKILFSTKINVELISNIQFKLSQII